MSGVTRRSLLVGVGGVGALLSAGGLGSCSSTSGNDRLRFYNWQDYINGDLLTSFAEQADIPVSYSTYSSNDELLKRLTLSGTPRRGNRQANGFDLIVPSNNLFARLVRQEALQPIDSGVVTKSLLGKLAPELAETGVSGGARYAIPWAIGSTGIAYNSERFTASPDWSAFFANADASIKSSLLNETREAFAAALFADGQDPNSTDAALLEAAAQRLKTFRSGGGTFSSKTYLADLAAGKLDLAQSFSSDFVIARSQNPALKFVIPANGGTRWVDLLCIPANAPNPAGANKFMAFYLDPAVSAQNANSVQVDTGNIEAKQRVSPEVRNELAVFPDEATRGRLVALLDLGEDEAMYTDKWGSISG